MFGTILLLTQVAAVPLQSATDQRPVRLWLGASPVTTGSAMPVYVAAASDGYLLVLRVATDGRVSVVFPADPKATGFVTRGSYEMRDSTGQPALIVNDRRGTGLVLAALSETPFRFSEFARTGKWDGALLVASYPGADGPGTLTDIAQRMLGDGWFNSDFALYTVRSATPRTAVRAEPPVAAAPVELDPAMQAQIATCNGCTVVYQTVLPTPVLEQTPVQQAQVEPVVIYASVCDVYLGGCMSPAFYSDNYYKRHDRVGGYRYDGYDNFRRFKTEGVCTIGVDCPPRTRQIGKAMTVPPTGSLTLSPVPRPTPPEAPQPPPYYNVAASTRVATAATVSRRVIGTSKAAPMAMKSGAIGRPSAPTGVALPARAKGGAVARATTVSAGTGVRTKGSALGGRSAGTALQTSKSRGAATRRR